LGVGTAGGMEITFEGMFLGPHLQRWKSWRAFGPLERSPQAIFGCLDEVILDIMMVEVGGSVVTKHAEGRRKVAMGFRAWVRKTRCLWLYM